MDKEFISVCMSTYNEKIDWLQNAINSVLNQTYKNFEFLIVLDNPENHEILELLREFERKDQRIQVFINERNKGLVYSLNKIISKSKGKYIMRMDADDISYPTRIEKSLKKIQKNQADFIITDAIEINEDGVQIGYKSVRGAGNSKSHYYGMVSIHPTWFVKKAVYEELKGYRDINYAEDYDFLIRAILKNKKIVAITEPLLKYRMRSNSISRSNSLDQFLISERIAKEFRNAIRRSNSELPRIEEKVLVTESERTNYALGLNMINEASSDFKNKNYVKGTGKLFKAVRKSRFTLKKIMNIAWFKVSKSK